MASMGFGPGNIDCDAVLADVYLYLDQETDEGLRNRIREHLDGCAPCLRQFGLEQDVRALVSRCCGSDRAPAPASTSGSGCGSPRSRSRPAPWSTAPNRRTARRHPATRGAIRWAMPRAAATAAPIRSGPY